MTKQTEALKLALEALEGLWKDGFEGYPAVLHENAITAIREALAEESPGAEHPAQQPHCNDCGGFDLECPLAQPSQPQEPICDDSVCIDCGMEHCECGEKDD